MSKVEIPKGLYLWMFKNESGDDAYPLFWSNINPDEYDCNDDDFPLRDKVIYWIGDDYDKEEDYIYGEVYAFSKLELLDYEQLML